jgi:YidC/Oxa1 family membrane protein insertase
MMDKRTVWMVVVCMLALFGWQMLVNKMYPPRPKAVKPVSLTTATNAAPAQTVSASTNQAATISPASAEPETPRGAEQVIVLSNDVVRVEFTNWGGGIRSVELFKYKANVESNIVLNAEATVPALAIEQPPYTNGVYELQQTSPTSVVMRARLKTGAQIVKQISLGSAYLLTGSIQVSPASASESSTQSMTVAIGTAVPANGRELQQIYLGVDWFAAGKYQNRALKQLWKNVAQTNQSESVQAKWVAVKSQFFTMIFTPGTDTLAVAYEPAHLPAPSGWNGKTAPDSVSASVTVPPDLMTNGVASYNFTYYAGPKEYDRLVALGGGQEDVMQFGFWGPISIWLLKGMKFFYGIIPNYGVAIIIITVLIKLLFWPIQAKSIRSMKEMQKFQPLMNKLREKYKDDAQRLNQETMKLYKEHKINPFSGCLPMLVQIPVFFALYAMLRTSIELRGAHFLWIHDLSQPDTIFRIAGFPLNPLPLFMTGAMVLQQRITPQTGDSQQAKMMMFMPLMMLYFFYTASSGLTLYWTVQQVLSIGQQWWSLRQADASPPGAKALPAGKPK